MCEKKRVKTKGIRLNPAQQELEARLRAHIGLDTFAALVKVLLKDGERTYLVKPQQDHWGNAVDTPDRDL